MNNDACLSNVWATGRETCAYVRNIDDNSSALLFKCGSISIVGIFVYWAKVGYLLKLKYASALSIQPVLNPEVMTLL